MEMVIIVVLSIVDLVLTIALVFLLGQYHSIVNDPKRIEFLANKLKKSGDALKQSIDTNTPK